DMAPALMAMNARVKISGPKGQKIVPLEKFFIAPRVTALKENVLEPGELITEVQVPAAPANAKGVFMKKRIRGSWDFALASVAAMVTLKAGMVQEARIVLGGVSTIPLRSTAAESAIKGKRLDAGSASQAGEAAVAKARPMTQNGYKIDMARGMVREALLAVV
ncbi:MAG: FAD binding domain-containing protein, partial [Deltaproteobacteria bacterium]|nr:FAD binding domain-containing protein [Deltaproteobacteria bacterium]